MVSMHGLDSIIILILFFYIFNVAEKNLKSNKLDFNLFFMISSYLIPLKSDLNFFFSKMYYTNHIKYSSQDLKIIFFTYQITHFHIFLFYLFIQSMLYIYILFFFQIKKKLHILLST